MTSQNVRQAARRAALDAQTRVRQRKEERDKRRSRLGVRVVTALAERDAQIRVFELRAGEALTALIEQEGLTAREAAEWCGLSSREVKRLLRPEPATPARPPAAREGMTKSSSISSPTASTEGVSE